MNVLRNELDQMKMQFDEKQMEIKILKFEKESMFEEKMLFKQQVRKLQEKIL